MTEVRETGTLDCTPPCTYRVLGPEPLSIEVTCDALDSVRSEAGDDRSRPAREIALDIAEGEGVGAVSNHSSCDLKRSV